MYARILSLVVLLALASAHGARAQTGACEALRSVVLQNGAITSARVDADRCRVEATLRPSPGSDIKIEVWLPLAGWNGKMLAVGNGAYGGTIPYPALTSGVAQGYATVATDTGHTGAGAAFAVGAPDKLRDFVERAVHQMTVHGKSIAARYYGRAPSKAYFNGCSTGGRQALTAAQRYPSDFDGIVAGSPGNYTSRQAFGQVWVAQAMQKDPASRVPVEKLPLLHKAVLEACEPIDGVPDGVLEDPTKCEFDPAALLCRGADGPDCLTAAQAEAVRRTYQGARHPKTGEPIFPGFERGSERGWARWVGAQPADYGVEFFKHLVFKDPQWDFRTLNFEGDLTLADQASAGIDAVDPDLTPLFSRGAKLLMYAGWNDPGIAPRNAVNYYTSVVQRVGEDKARDAIRLFMVPGMAHCGGGEGTSTFDMLPALEVWVEKGIAPAHIPASRVTKGTVERTRPLCPYPQVATYTGRGSTDDAASFVCR